MYVCVCRAISDKNYNEKGSLKKRLLADDFRCGKCLVGIDVDLVPDVPKKELPNN